jgi:hypothetical protein
MLIIKEREFMLGHADWAGGYLYRNASYVGWHSARTLLN